MLREFVPDRATAQEWAAFHALRRAEHTEDDPDVSPLPDAAAEAMVRAPDSATEQRYYIEWRDGEALGRLRTWVRRPGSPEYETNRHLMDAKLWVLPAQRRRGIARGWLPTIVDAMRASDTGVLTIWTKREDGHAFARWLGAERKRTEKVSRLDLEAVDWPMVRRWIEEGERRSPGSSLVFHPHRVPVEALPEFAAALTTLFNTIPFEGQEHGDFVTTPELELERFARMDATGAGQDTILIRDPDGSIVAITGVMTSGHEPEFIDQGFTGVLPHARGRGLGKWVKAAMLERIRERHPRARWITTGNAQSNGPMLAINVGLGFRFTDVTVVYQIGQDALAARI